MTKSLPLRLHVCTQCLGYFLACHAPPLQKCLGKILDHLPIHGKAEVAAGSYVVGGMIPLLPYMLAANAHQALMVSIVVTLLALTLFGFVKGHFTGVSKFKSAWQTALVGSLAASVAFAIAKAIS